jgi:hypothetical protein
MSSHLLSLFSFYPSSLSLSRSKQEEEQEKQARGEASKQERSLKL